MSMMRFDDLTVPAGADFHLPTLRVHVQCWKVPAKGAAVRIGELVLSRDPRAAEWRPRYVEEENAVRAAWDSTEDLATFDHALARALERDADRLTACAAKVALDPSADRWRGLPQDPFAGLIERNAISPIARGIAGWLTGIADRAEQWTTGPSEWTRHGVLNLDRDYTAELEVPAGYVQQVSIFAPSGAMAWNVHQVTIGDSLAYYNNWNRDWLPIGDGTTEIPLIPGRGACVEGARVRVTVSPDPSSPLQVSPAQDAIVCVVGSHRRPARATADR